MLKAIISSAKSGDRDAFRALYDMLSGKVFRFIRPRAKNREDALDILQETFVDFWKGLSRFEYRDDQSLYSYLYTIASRKIIRSYKWWNIFLSIESLEDVLIDERDDNTEAVFDVLNALSKLSPSDSEIITLRHIQDLPFEEISQLLDSSVNTLKVRHHRAMGRLRRRLDKYYE